MAKETKSREEIHCQCISRHLLMVWCWSPNLCVIVPSTMGDWFLFLGAVWDRDKFMHSRALLKREMNVGICKWLNKGTGAMACAAPHALWQSGAYFPLGKKQNCWYIKMGAVSSSSLASKLPTRQSVSHCTVRPEVLAVSSSRLKVQPLLPMQV